MADAADPDTPPPKASLFLGCFGFSGKRINISTKTSGKVHQKRRWFRRSTVLLKQSAAGAKTVPLDSDKIPIKKSSSMVTKSKLKKKSAGDDFPLKPQSPAPVKPPQEQISLKGRPSLDKKVKSENGEVRKNDIPPLTPTVKSFSKRINTIRNASSQPGSPDQSNRTTVHHSASLPAPVSTKKRPKEITTNNLDPMIGMSIIMVTLVILLIWGRLCAILCTCTWLYFVPRLRKKPVQINGSVSLKQEPEEYMKKRVVFEGFLERNHNRNFL